MDPGVGLLGKARAGKILVEWIISMLDPEAEQGYIRLAQERPNMLCSEAPVEILQASAYAGEEPTPLRVPSLLAVEHVLAPYLLSFLSRMLFKNRSMSFLKTERPSPRASAWTSSLQPHFSIM